MSRLTAVVLLCLSGLAACRRDDHNEQKVQQAILERLGTHSGLDLNTLDVSTTGITFDKNLAYATVSFHPKGDSNLASGMVMKYTLQDNDGKWVVVKVGDSQGRSLTQGHGASADGTRLPPGHPEVGAPQAGAGGTQ